MLKKIQEDFNLLYNIKITKTFNYMFLYYLYFIFEKSIVNKDIKLFLLFLYLHDTCDNIDFDSKLYLEWKYSTTIQLAYEPNIITKHDLYHYCENLNNETDKKIYYYIQNNILYKNNLFLKKFSWTKFNLKKLFKIYAKCLGKVIILFYKVLHNRYKPYGKGYFELLFKWNNNKILN